MLLRYQIRPSGILNFVHLFSTIKSIDGKDLDSSLAEVKYIAKSNYENYKNNFFETRMCSCKVGGYNGLYQLNCLLTVTNRYN